MSFTVAATRVWFEVRFINLWSENHFYFEILLRVLKQHLNIGLPLVNSSFQAFRAQKQEIYGTWSSLNQVDDVYSCVLHARHSVGCDMRIPTCILGSTLFLFPFNIIGNIIRNISHVGDKIGDISLPETIWVSLPQWSRHQKFRYEAALVPYSFKK